MREIGRSPWPDKIYLVGESRKSFNGLEFSGGQPLKWDSLAVILETFNRLNPLTQPQHASISIPKRQSRCCIRQTRFDFDPRRRRGNETDPGVEGLRVNGSDACETQQRASCENLSVRTKHAIHFPWELTQSIRKSLALPIKNLPACWAKNNFDSAGRHPY